MTINKNLNWTTHIRDTSLAAFKKLGFLRHKLKYVATTNVKLLAYNSLVRPKLKFGGKTWDPDTKSNSEILGRVQRHAVRFIFEKFQTTDSPSLSMEKYELYSTVRRIAHLKLLHSIKKSVLGFRLLSKASFHNTNYAPSSAFLNNILHMYQPVKIFVFSCHN